MGGSAIRAANWTHHTVLAAIAFTFLQLERIRSNDDVRPTLPAVRCWVREIMAVTGSQ